MASENHGLWGSLPLLLRANSKESVEYILQALWRTRKTGLDATDRQIFRQMLQLQTDNELDPLLACLRILIRRCVYESVNKDEIQNLFPFQVVLPELQRLLTLLLQKFQNEWREDALGDQAKLPESRAVKRNLASRNTEEMDAAAAVTILKDGTADSSEAQEVNKK